MTAQTPSDLPAIAGCDEPMLAAAISLAARVAVAKAAEGENLACEATGAIVRRRFIAEVQPTTTLKAFVALLMFCALTPAPRRPG